MTWKIKTERKAGPARVSPRERDGNNIGQQFCCGLLLLPQTGRPSAFVYIFTEDSRLSLSFLPFGCCLSFSSVGFFSLGLEEEEEEEQEGNAH